ncbi:MAG: hypothetical protein ACXWG1_11635 [Usitatibacter sp.]
MSSEPRKLAAATIAALTLYASLACAQEADVAVQLPHGGKIFVGGDAGRFAASYAPWSWLSFDLEIAGLDARFDDGTSIPGATRRIASAGATLHTPDGWTASLLVNSLGRRDSLVDDSTPVRQSTFVNARLSRNLSKRSRLSLDVFNIFDLRARNLDYFATSRLWDQPGAGDSFLFNPAEPRGFRVKLRTTF